MQYVAAFCYTIKASNLFVVHFASLIVIINVFCRLIHCSKVLTDIMFIFKLKQIHNMQMLLSHYSRYCFDLLLKKTSMLIA